MDNEAIADEVAALRRDVREYGGKIQDWRDYRRKGQSEKASLEQSGALELFRRIDRRLDRIAAAAPQRATDSNGTPLWLHVCGRVVACLYRGPNWCSACDEHDEWRQLYVDAG